MLTTHEIRCPMIYDGRIPSPVIVYHLTVHNLQQVLYSFFIHPKWFAEFPSTISAVASIWTSLNLKTLDFWSEVENICSWAWFWGCNVEQRWLLVQQFIIILHGYTLIYWFGWIIVVYPSLSHMCHYFRVNYHYQSLPRLSFFQVKNSVWWYFGRFINASWGWWKHSYEFRRWCDLPREPVKLQGEVQEDALVGPKSSMMI